jgi:hypothetical protein
MLTRIAILIVVGFLISADRWIACAAGAQEPCCIEVVDRDSRWPVPLVELRTTHQQRFVTDNAGIIAMDSPELLGRETWFSVLADGYEAKADGFGFRGVRLTPQPGKTLTVEVTRTSIAKRLGRITGGGLFAECQKLGRRAACSVAIVCRMRCTGADCFGPGATQRLPATR